MAVTGIPTFDHAPQVVADWLNESCEDLGWKKSGADFLLCKTLRVVQDFLAVDVAADLAAQLPVLLRGIYDEGWAASKTPVKERNKKNLLQRIESRFRNKPLENSERAVAAVSDFLRRHVSGGEFQQLKQAMRGPIQDLWE